MESNNILEIPFELLNDDNHSEDIKMPHTMREIRSSFAPQYTLYRLIKYLKPKKILEIGIDGKSSSITMAYAQRDNGHKVDITYVDSFLTNLDNDGAENLSLWQKEVHKSGYLANGIRLFLSTTNDFFSSNKEKFDFIVINGRYEYHHIKNDFLRCTEHSEIGSTIWLNNYTSQESVTNATNEIIIQKQLPFSVNEIKTNIKGESCDWVIVRNMPYRHLRDSKNVEVKLNLGCGADYKEGWINIDLNPNVRTDIKTDFLKLDQIFSTSSVDFIEMIHCLPYLNLWDTEELLKKLYKILKPNSVLCLEMPNIEKAINKIIESGYLNGSGNLGEYIEGVRPFYAFGLDNMAAKESYTPYSFIWSPNHLSDELKKVGFREIKILPPETHSPWRDMRVEAVK